MNLIAVAGDPVLTTVNPKHKCNPGTTCAPVGPNLTVTVGGIPAVVFGHTTASHTYEVGDKCLPHVAALNLPISTVLIGGVPVAKVLDTFASPCGGQITKGQNFTVFAD